MIYTKKQLIKKDLIFEEVSGTDRRVSYLSLTEKGKKLIEEVIKKYDILLDILLRKLNSEEKKTTSQIIEKNIHTWTNLNTLIQEF